jgi:hypothetical protein
MLEIEMKRKLARHFGLKNLDMAGEIHIKDAETDETKITDVKFVWMAEIHKYTGYTPVGGRNLFVAVVKTPNWRKGVLLVPAEIKYDEDAQEIMQTDKEYIGGDALPALDLTDDPVEDMLRCVDLTSSHYPKNIRTRQEHSFELLIRTPVIRTDLSVRTRFHQEENQNTRIWGAVAKVIRTLQEQYNREDMDEFFKWQGP